MGRVPDPRETLVEDVHARLHGTHVRRIVRPLTLRELRATIVAAGSEGLAVSVCGARHAMGGQPFGRGTLLIDTTGLDRVLDLDLERGRVTAEAGIRWPALFQGILQPQAGRANGVGILQKQTGANELSLGGSLSANVHGRGLDLPPLGAQVESFTLVDAQGRLHACSRESEPELFRLAIGGYGLFGVIYSVTLRLSPRRKVRREVEVIDLAEVLPAFEERLADGCLYGDFQFAIDPVSPDFLRRGVFACYRPVDPGTPIPDGQRRLLPSDWVQLTELAHTRKSEAFRRYSEHYAATSGQIYWSDTHQLGTCVDNYHEDLDRRLGRGERASEVITELYVPRGELVAFLAEARADLERRGADLIYGTVRLIRRDEETFLPWAREDWACVIFNLHTVHTPEGIARSAAAFRSSIDLALLHRGSFYLTYHRFATREQIEAAHPRFAAFLAEKRRFDPDERFQSDWYRHVRGLFGSDGDGPGAAP